MGITTEQLNEVLENEQNDWTQTFAEPLPTWRKGQPWSAELSVELALDNVRSRLYALLQEGT